MSKRYYDDWLKKFVEFASYGEAPFKMLFWTGVSTIAGALRRRVWIEQKYWQWIPNFYVIMVAPPGIVSKSTTANIGMNILRELKEIKFGPDVITWQQLITSLAKSNQSDPDPRTGEFYPMCAVTFCSDELGNLLKMRDTDLIDALVALWDGKKGAFSKETKTMGGDTIENPFVNIIGCTTPSWISMNVPEYMVGGGFTSRCVFVYADEKRQLVPYVDEVVPPDFEETKKHLAHDLEIISMMFGEFEISKEARAWGREWYKRHWTVRPAHWNTEQFAAYMSRKQTHIHKLAMVLSASAGDTMAISAQHLEAAEAMVSAVEADVNIVFSRIGQNSVTRGTAEIVQMVTRNPGISGAELFKNMVRTHNWKEFSDALTGAINSDQIHCLTRTDGPHYYPKAPKEQQSERKADETGTG